MKNFLLQASDYFRMWLWAVIAVALLVSLQGYQQFLVVAYKLSLVSLAAWVGYWVDRNLFRNSRYEDSQAFDYVAYVGIRRALIVAAVILATALAL